MSDIDQFARVGALLYGERWQRAMAQALGAHERTIRKWLNRGETPTDVRDHLLRLMKARQDELREALRDLKVSR